MAHPNDTGGNRRKLAIFGTMALMAGRYMVSYAIESLVVAPSSW